MTKRLRLTEAMRDQLRHFANGQVMPAAEKAAAEATYKVAAPKVLAMVHLKFPPRDMKICAKYGVASIDNCIKMQFPNGVVDTFRFDRDSGPLVTQPTYKGQIYLADDATAGLVETWLNATAALTAERKKRIAAYGGLITSAKFLDEITPIWPEAADAIPKTNLPIALGPAEIEIIEADVAERSKA